MKKIISIFSIIVLCFLLTGCGEAKDKTYSSNSFSITMQDGFTEKSLANSTVYFEATESMVSALKEELTRLKAVGITEDSTIEDYLDVVNTNNKTDYEVQTDGDLKYFTYENEGSGKTFFYLSAAYKTDDAFWLVNFAAEASNKEKYEPLFIKWAKTAEFDTE